MPLIKDEIEKLMLHNFMGRTFHVASIQDRNGHVETFGLVGGMPLPYRVMSALIVAHIYGFEPDDYNSTGLEKVITDLWTKVTLPAMIIQAVRGSNPAKLVRSTIRSVMLDIAESEKDKGDIKNVLIDMIRQIEEDYVTGLQAPIEVDDLFRDFDQPSIARPVWLYREDKRSLDDYRPVDIKRSRDSGY